MSTLWKQEAAIALQSFVRVKGGEMGMRISALRCAWMWSSTSWPKNVRPTPFIQSRKKHCFASSPCRSWVKGNLLRRPLCCPCTEVSLHKAWRSFSAEMGVYPCRNRVPLNRRSLKINKYVFGLENAFRSLDPPARREHADPPVWPDSRAPSFP